MATRFVVVNDATGKYSLATLGSSLFVIEDFEVVVSGTTFTTVQSFSAPSIIEVWKNGQLVREGAGNDWTRSITNQIIFNSPVDAGGWVRIKIWL